MEKNSPSQKPLLHFIDQFLEWILVEKGLSKKTQENYYHFLKVFEEFLKQKNLENISPNEISPDLIYEYKVFLAKKNLKKTTQNYYLIALRQFFLFLEEIGENSLSPTKIKLLRQKETRKIHFLTLDQVEKLLSQPDTSTFLGLRDRAILEVLFSTGMRAGELLSLKRDQIKIEKIQPMEIVIKGKGGKLRPVYLSERAVFWLKKYLDQREDNEKALFLSKRKKPLSRRQLDEIVKKYVIKAGLPLETRPHTLRHSFATDLLMKGVDLRVVQEFLGHQNISTTQVYTHVTSQKLKEIHQKFHGKRK